MEEELLTLINQDISDTSIKEIPGRRYKTIKDSVYFQEQRKKGPTTSKLKPKKIKRMARTKQTKRKSQGLLLATQEDEEVSSMSEGGVLDSS